LRRTNKAGIVFVALGLALFGAYAAWHGTRNWVPVDIAAPIFPGSTLNKDFSVNVDAPYTIEIAADKKKIDFDTLNCLLGMSSVLDKKCTTAEVVTSDWALTEGTKLMGSGSSSTDHGGAWANDTISREIGSFQGKSGHRYKVEVKFLEDGTALNAATPRLVIGVHPEVYEGDAFRSAFVFLFSAGFVLIGCCLVVASVLVRLCRRTPRTARS